MTDLAEQITREFNREIKENAKAVAKEDIPITYEAITPEWLTNTLCSNTTGAKVIDFSLDEADDGNANRRRIFLSYNQQGIDAGLPATVFCKASQKLPNRLIMASCGLIEGEISFYKNYRAMVDIEAPICYWANYNPVSYNSIIMINDLAPSGAEFCDHRTPMSKARAISQLNLLARLHGKFYESDAVKNSSLASFEDVFNNNNTWFGLESCCNNGFLQAEAVIPPQLFSQFEKVWPATLQSAALHANVGRTFTHVDPHLKNWYVAGNGEMGLCDWQTFGSGHWGRDMAYTISTALTVDDRRLWEKELVQYYLTQLETEGGPKVSFDEGWLLYRQHLFSSLAWWTLTLAPSSGSSDEAPPEFHDQAVTLEFIKRMTTAIDDLDALDSFG